MTSREKALEGLRVIEIGSLIGGPFCGTLLSEFGAEVIKVEDPKVGDPARNLGKKIDETSSFFISLARNKKCITLDLRVPEGQRLFKRLVPLADVVLENFRPDTLRGWGLDYPELSKINPRLVLAHVSGFGQYGPYRDRLAFDRIATAFAGQDYITGFPDKPPVRPAGALADYITALFCTIGVMFAIYHRDFHGGKGQEIDIALYEGLFRLMNQVEEYGQFGIIPERMGNSNPQFAPAQTFMTKDRQWLVINAGTDNIWKRFVKTMDRDDLDQDPKFQTQRKRAENQETLHAIIAEWTARNDLKELLDRLEKAGIPACKINNIADTFHDPHIAARENIIETVLGSGRKIMTSGIVPKLSESPGSIEYVAPALGAHNEEIYQNLLSLSDGEYGALKIKGII
ncbi:MAG: CoA transferase [Deltaproteobacteria bacterium]|nr:CoA transferase [Deltaproteobacteria bacterium]